MELEPKEVEMKLEKVNIRIGSLIKVKPEYEERYIILHKHVFPGVLDRIRKSNIRNYSIFLNNGLLFSYMEYVGNNYDKDMNDIADKTTKEWWKLTDPMQEPLSIRKEGEWWVSMDSIQFFDGNFKPYTEGKRFAYTSEVNPGLEQDIKNLFIGFNDSFSDLLKDFNIQNHNVFKKGSRLYVYFEYTGNNFENDNQHLNNKPQFKKWNDDLAVHLKTQWEEMKEVFHTD